VVLPDADLKIYLDATVEERAERRYREVVVRGEPAEFESVLAAVRKRDTIDSGREVAPLRAAEDAINIDTTALSIEGVLELVLQLVENWHPKRDSLSH
jgi:cytidylate kinase